MELILGRQPVFPIEFQHNDVDFTGTELTKPLVDDLVEIHDTAFGKASKQIKKEQERYARAYDKRYKTNPLKLRIGMKIQVKKETFGSFLKGIFPKGFYLPFLDDPYHFYSFLSYRCYFKSF